MSNTYRVINVIRQAIDQETENGARIKYMPAVIVDGGGAYEVSAYIAGNDVASAYIRQHSGAYTAAGAYTIVGITDNDMWVDQLLPTDNAYAKLAIDYNNGKIYTGSGSVPPTTEFAGTASSSTAWTPVLTFSTPGDLNVVYSQVSGLYYRMGRLVFYEFSLTTSTFTHTTASGSLRITGLPFTVSSASAGFRQSGNFSGWTKASYTQATPSTLANNQYVSMLLSGSGQAAAVAAASDMPTGGTVVMAASGWYEST